MYIEAAMFEALIWIVVAAFVAVIALAINWLCNKAECELFGDKGEWR